MEIQEKIAIVTGASEGIGRETARALAARGARVVVAARSASRLDELVAEIREAGGQALAVPTDVRSDDDVARMVETTVERFGGLDILVNNAGYGLMGALAELPIEEVQAVFDVNVFGVLRCTQAAVPEMRRRGGGAIVNVSSVVGRVTLPYAGAYSATKHALNALSTALRAELRAEKINVITVMPGRIDTSFAENAVRHEVWQGGRYRGVPPSRVARAIARAIERDARSLVVPWWYRPLRAGRALAPDLVDGIVARSMRSEP